MGKSTIAQNIETRVVSIDKLNPSTYNPRVDLTESDAEYQHIKNSLESFGYLDPIVWNERTGNIISGHQRYKILVADGATELEVKVVDFDLETEKACNLAMNKTTGLWDDEKLNALLKEMAATTWDMADFGFLLDQIGESEDEQWEDDGNVVDDGKQNPYTQNTNAPIYQPTGESPALSDLCDTTKADQLQAEIRETDIPEDIKNFLYLASCRHYKFNYKNIAEYYCHANSEVQNLMEKSALVIVDFNKAIEYGFAKLQKKLTELRAIDANFKDDTDVGGTSDESDTDANTPKPTIYLVIGGSCAGKSSYVKNTFIRNRTPKTTIDILPITELEDCILVGKYDTGVRRVGTDCLARQQIKDIFPQVQKLVKSGKDIILEGVRLISNPLFENLSTLHCRIKLVWIKISVEESIKRVKESGGNVSASVLKTECTKAMNIYNRWKNRFDCKIIDTTGVKDFTQFSEANLCGAKVSK